MPKLSERSRLYYSKPKRIKFIGIIVKDLSNWIKIKGLLNKKPA